jgi:hypothetical protein
VRDPVDVGQAVRHARFGLGAALRSDERRTTIEFQDHGVKTFVTSLLEVELTDEQPVRPRVRRTKATTT